MSSPQLENGVHRPSSTEVILVRDGRTVRRVLSATEGDQREVRVYRTFGVENEEEHSALFEQHVSELEDDGNAVTRCSFCEKARDEVPALVAGPRCYICSECITLCQELIE